MLTRFGRSLKISSLEIDIQLECVNCYERPLQNGETVFFIVWWDTDSLRVKFVKLTFDVRIY